jgi:hypothetical protein
MIATSPQPMRVPQSLVKHRYNAHRGVLSVMACVYVNNQSISTFMLLSVERSGALWNLFGRSLEAKRA